MLFLAMVIAGFVLPSPGVGVVRPDAPASQYHQASGPVDPELLIVPSISIRAPIVPIETTPDGVLHPPADVDEVGWWKRSAKPGATSGQTLITGHTVHTGGGVMNRLGDLRPGALVRVKTPEGMFDFTTTKVFVYTRAELAQHAKELFGQKRPDYRLVLVTCTGWTGHDYTSNIIVFASPLGIRNGTEPKTPPVEKPTPRPSDEPTGEPGDVGAPA
ncbi:MAG: class F sortase [Nocardioidaceae bacterium]|nr:class F sortase [Nocardioidaceae bacterium]